MKQSSKGNKVKFLVMVLAVMAIVGAVFMCGCSIVGPGERGVRISLGKASDEPKQPGAYLWFPFLLGMAKVDVQIQKTEITASAASQDMQEITTTVAVNWSLDPSRTVDTYKTIGDERDVLERIVIPAVNEILKSATAKRTAEQILKQRMELKADIDDGLKVRLAKHGLNFNDVSIVHLEFSKQFTEAIEEKQIAEQKSQQAHYEAEKAIQDAKAEVNRAQGQAESQRLIKQTITTEILQQRAIEKWDGKFPQVMGSGALPFINLKL